MFIRAQEHDGCRIGGVIMNYSVEVLPGEPIILMCLYAEARVSEDMSRSSVEVKALLDQAAEPVFLIMDMSKMTISLNDIILGSNMGTRSEQPLNRHPQLREMLFVSPSALVKLAVKGLNTVTFGNLEFKVFDTVDDALTYVRS
jgi:hypothetical protein